MALDRPADVLLAPGVAGGAGYDKDGADLVMRLAGGETARIENFFVIGPNGDFSRLLSAGGDVVATGLMAPEPEYPDEPDAVTDVGAGDAITNVDAVEVASDSAEESVGSGGIMANGLTPWIGAGLLVGSGIAFSSDSGGSDDGSGAVDAGQVVDEGEIATDLSGDALLPPEDDLTSELLSSRLISSDEPDVPSGDVAAEPVDTDANETDAVETEAGQFSDTLEGYILPEDAEPMMNEPQAELFSDLDTEFTA
jgi:hypothetical protein